MAFAERTAFKTSVSSHRTILDYSYSWFTEDDFDSNLVEEGPAGELYKKFKIGEICPYCNRKAIKAVEGRYDPAQYDDLSGDDYVVIVWGCPFCGWWHESFHRWDLRLPGWERLRYRIAGLRKFDVGSEDLPLTTLKSELKRYPHILHDIHASKFEALVADVLSSFFQVEVTTVGRTGDGGIDLVYVDGETPFAVQVKRRLSSGSKEGVALIREFLGACMLEGKRNGKIVTTANSFTEGAKGAAKKAVNMGLVESFELIARDRFLELFGYQKKIYRYPWTSIVRDWLDVWAPDEDKMQIRVSKRYMK